MKPPLATRDDDERGRAVRDTFPGMPHGGDVLFGALIDAAASDLEEPPPQPIAEHEGPE